MSIGGMERVINAHSNLPVIFIQFYFPCCITHSDNPPSPDVILSIAINAILFNSLNANVHH